MALPETVELLGVQHVVVLPDLCTREQLAEMVALHAGKEYLLRRVCAAAIGLCTGIGARSAASLPRHGFDVLAYGGQVLSWLRAELVDDDGQITKEEVTYQEIVDAASLLLVPMRDARFPRQEEVDKVVDFTGAGEGKRAG